MKNLKLKALEAERNELFEKAENLVIEFLDMFDDEADDDIINELKKIRERYHVIWSEASELI